MRSGLDGLRRVDTVKASWEIKWGLVRGNGGRSEEMGAGQREWRPVRGNDEVLTAHWE